MDFPIIIIWVSPLSFLGVLVVVNIYFLPDFFSMKFLKANRIASLIWVSPLSFLGVLVVIFIFYLIFSMKFLKAFCGVTSGAILFVCPIKRTPGLNELRYENRRHNTLLSYCHLYLS